jgi:hypothetical protein
MPAKHETPEEAGGLVFVTYCFEQPPSSELENKLKMDHGMGQGCLSGTLFSRQSATFSSILIQVN